MIPCMTPCTSARALLHSHVSCQRSGRTAVRRSPRPTRASPGSLRGAAPAGAGSPSAQSTWPAVIDAARQHGRQCERTQGVIDAARQHGRQCERTQGRGRARERDLTCAIKLAGSETLAGKMSVLPSLARCANAATGRRHKTVGSFAKCGNARWAYIPSMYFSATVSAIASFVRVPSAMALEMRRIDSAVASARALMLSASPARTRGNRLQHR